jgi:hypothetical protein
MASDAMIKMALSAWAPKIEIIRNASQETRDALVSILDDVLDVIDKVGRPIKGDDVPSLYDSVMKRLCDDSILKEMIRKMRSV